MKTPERSILIIDDERIFTFLLAEELSENPNYHVQTTHSGEDALKIMHNQTFDLIIADLKLPGITGLEFVSVAKKMSPQTKVILMSAYNVHKMEQRIRELGVNSYIYKPFSMSRISELVGNTLYDGTNYKHNHYQSIGQTKEQRDAIVMYVKENAL